MRRVGLVMVVAVACAVGLPAVAPPAAGTVLQVALPAPDFNNDGFAVGTTGRTCRSICRRPARPVAAPPARLTG